MCSLTNSAGVMGDTIAEHVLGGVIYLLAVLRHRRQAIRTEILGQGRLRVEGHPPFAS